MSVYVVAVHLSGGTRHEHIATVLWVNESTMKSGISTIAGMVGFIDGKNSVMVSDGATKTSVGVVRDGSKPPYIRSYADNKWTDNLLSLPRF